MAMVVEIAFHMPQTNPELVHQVSDWGSGAAAYFGWMREGPSRTGI
jgi:hypothetical protein